MHINTGFFGRIGKFFIIGPREYGVHPTNKMFAFLNRRYNYAMAMALHRYPVLKALTANGYNMMRPLKHMSIFGPIAALAGIFRFVYFHDSHRSYDPDKLTYLTRRIGGHMGLPFGSMNQITSAHFIEINAIYSAEMLKRYHKAHGRIISERGKVSEEEKRTKYADPTYKYVASKTIVNPGPALPFV